jgi:exonuclease III
MVSVNCLIWNARGLNDRARRDTVHQVVQSCGPIIVCLQETKLALISDFDVLSCCTRDEGWDSGGLPFRDDLRRVPSN